MAITKEKRINIGKFHLALGMDVADAEKMRQAAPYKYLIRPMLSFVSSLGSRRNGARANGHRRPAIQEPIPAAMTDEAHEVMDRIKDIDWYHVIELPHGVVTQGFVDHRNQLDMYGLPEDMTGMRALDVATYDGFWAREMERRGAEVVAIDIETMADVDLPRNWEEEMRKSGIDKPTGAGFKIAAELLDSKVRREICSVYDLGPEKFGMFDVAFCSDLLLHLRDPLKAIENVWRVVKQYAIFADVYQPELENLGAPLIEFAVKPPIAMWWRPNSRCLKDMMKVARFSRIEEISRFQLNTDIERELHKIVLKAYR
ncbi:MAG: class I SAM-dependent methyltransferase [Dehalococcoidia bacterium]